MYVSIDKGRLRKKERKNIYIGTLKSQVVILDKMKNNIFFPSVPLRLR